MFNEQLAGASTNWPRPVINNMNTPTTESLTLQEQGQQLSVLGAFANSEIICDL